MTLSYFIRLLCLGAASFFLINAALGLGVKLFSAPLIRIAGRMRPRAAARLLFTLRMTPVVIAAIVVLGLCVPSYLWLEPSATNEEVGFVFICAAILGAAVLALSIIRAIRAMADTFTFTQKCTRPAERIYLSGESQEVFVMESHSPTLAMSGVFLPKLVISREVMSALSHEQLAAAVRHEQAHRSSRENLKRLFLLLTAEIAPFIRLHAGLDHAWAKYSEWAADDCAAEGNPRRSVSLAEALVRVARLGTPCKSGPLCTFLVPADQDLSARVNRLLQTPPPEQKPHTRLRILAMSACFAAALVVLVALLTHTATLHAVHGILERFIR